jgi:amidohydrolase
MLKEEIQQLAIEQLEEAITNRRYLHANPELSFVEKNTSEFIIKKLKALGIPHEIKADTGVVALLSGTRSASDNVVALRTDIDALPIQETNEVVYKSQNAGVMHACGHDVHTASLLATAGILSRLTNNFSGVIKFIFQPAEEKIPGGASFMIKEGVLENPLPKSILAQHVMPELPVGKVGFCGGSYMASNDELYITVTGKGGHGAMPHLNVDPVVITCQVITALQQIVSRQADPFTPSVLSFGKIIADGAVNVIPDKVKIEGTFRTTDEHWRGEAHKKIRDLVLSLVEGMGGTCDFELRKGYPVLVNDSVLTNEMRQHAEDYLGKDQVVNLDRWMASEDFAYYSQICPGCFYRLGTGNKAKGLCAPLHTPSFDIDEQALKTGAGLMAYLALKAAGN